MSVLLPLEVGKIGNRINELIDSSGTASVTVDWSSNRQMRSYQVITGQVISYKKEIASFFLSFDRVLSMVAIPLQMFSAILKKKH